MSLAIASLNDGAVWALGLALSVVLALVVRWAWRTR